MRKPHKDLWAEIVTFKQNILYLHNLLESLNKRNLIRAISTEFRKDIPDVLREIQSFHKVSKKGQR